MLNATKNYLLYIKIESLKMKLATWEGMKSFLGYD